MEMRTAWHTLFKSLGK